MTFSKREEGNSLSCSKAVSRAPPKLQWSPTLQESVGPNPPTGDLRVMSLFGGCGGKKKTSNEPKKAPPAVVA